MRRGGGAVALLPPPPESAPDNKLLLILNLNTVLCLIEDRSKVVFSDKYDHFSIYMYFYLLDSMRCSAAGSEKKLL